ncbi:hypothetical protein EHR06_03990 [Leptospira dzoumogneensis]|uniref:Uncharacterized protein n=1 Tax=Leptospira dzoumogneensis TaxID=2484904 RepID=A0A4Z1APW3_9LEPT|nr:hypothetical protein EHR06_03990 [Leptospira dzoumogneensis]
MRFQAGLLIQENYFFPGCRRKCR